MICHHCGNQVPVGHFCTNCGAEAGSQVHGVRHSHFALHPGEHVFQPSVFSTLLPHLHHSRVHEFRFALAGGVAVVALAAGMGFISGALIAAVVLFPVLYLLYLHDSQVYRNDPVRVVAITLGGGAVLGALVMLGIHLLLPDTTGTSLGDLLILGLAVPLIALVLMPLPALALRGGFGEALPDGLALGIASGLGFGLGEGLVRFIPVLPVLSIRSSALGWLYPLVDVAVLIPLFQGLASGVVTASVWHAHRGHALRVRGLVVAGVVVAAFGFFLGAQALQESGVPLILVGAYQLLMLGGVIIAARYLVHHAVLERVAGQPLRVHTCSQCHQHGQMSGFCPHCGTAVIIRGHAA